MAVRYLTIEQFAARHAGVSVPTLRRYVQRRQIRYAQPGGRGTRVLLPEDALDRLAQNDTNDVAPSDVSSDGHTINSRERRPLVRGVRLFHGRFIRG